MTCEGEGHVTDGDQRKPCWLLFLSNQRYSSSSSSPPSPPSCNPSFLNLSSFLLYYTFYSSFSHNLSTSTPLPSSFLFLTPPLHPLPPLPSSHPQLLLLHPSQHLCFPLILVLVTSLLLPRLLLHVLLATSSSWSFHLLPQPPPTYPPLCKRFPQIAQNKSFLQKCPLQLFCWI